MHSSPCRMGSISDERMPSPACTRCSCGGSSIASQSGRCSIFLESITCDGKLASASSGVSSAEGPVSGSPRPGDRHRAVAVALAHQQEGRRVLEEPERRADDGVEHGLDVVGRLADHAQDLGRRGLLLERLVRLVEQARVLDRDHRLVGKGLHERDLLVGNGARLARTSDEQPMTAPSSQHRRARRATRQPPRSPGRSRPARAVWGRSRRGPDRRSET